MTRSWEALSQNRAKFDAALAELVGAQWVSLDMPGAHLNLAVLAENQGRAAEAETEYLAALKLDPDFSVSGPAKVLSICCRKCIAIDGGYRDV